MATTSLGVVALVGQIKLMAFADPSACQQNLQLGIVRRPFAAPATPLARGPTGPLTAKAA